MNLKNSIIETLRKEVVPATGCTEPVAIALAAAKAWNSLLAAANPAYAAVDHDNLPVAEVPGGHM